MANITFKLRSLKTNKPQNIYLVYRFGRNEKLVYPTGFKIAPKYWNIEKMRVRNIVEAIGKDIINERLNALFVASENFCIETRAKGQEITKEALKMFLDVFTGKTRAINENNLHGFIGFYYQEHRKDKPKYGKNHIL